MVAHSPLMTTTMILLSPTAPCPIREHSGIKTATVSTSWDDMEITVTARYSTGIAYSTTHTVCSEIEGDSSFRLLEGLLGPLTAIDRVLLAFELRVFQDFCRCVFEGIPEGP